MRASWYVVPLVIASAAAADPRRVTLESAPRSNVVCEVEISGHVKVKASEAEQAAGAGAAAHSVTDPLTFVAIGDCLAPEPRIVGFSGSTRGRFFVEVFVPEGSELTLCAAREPTPGAPSTLYGKAKKSMVPRGRGEVEFKNLVVELAPGPPRRFVHQAGAN